MKEFLTSRAVLLAGVCSMFIGLSGLALESAQREVAPPQVKEQASVFNDLRTTIISNANGTVIQHDGFDGTSVLEVLRSGAEVQIDQSAIEQTILAINGVVRSEEQSWFVYVNGQKLNDSSAPRFLASAGDQVEWRLEEI